MNLLIRFDTWTTAVQYLSAGLAGKAYMGVGRNLAYKRSLFFENKGFGPHINLQSGDDDLFINQLAKGNNCSVVKLQDSFTRSIPASSFSALAKQKMRHLSTASFYSKSSKFLLILEPLSRVIFYALFMLLLLSNSSWQLTTMIFGFIILTKFIVLEMVQKALNEKDLLLFSLLFDLISPIINGYFLLLTRKNQNRSYEWK